MSDPQLLILDEPFDGLDVNSRQQLAALLADLHRAGLTLVLVLNRFDEIPEFVQYAGVLADCLLSETGEKRAILQQALVAQLAHSEKPVSYTHLDVYKRQVLCHYKNALHIVILSNT